MVRNFAIDFRCLDTWLGGAALALGAPRCLLYLLPLPLFFRFDVLVTIHLYDSH